MTINQLILQYPYTRIVSHLSGNEEELMKLLTELSVAIRRGGADIGIEEVQWQKELKEVSDDNAALNAFYEMFIRGISKKLSAIFVYYFAARVINNEEYPSNYALDAYYMRSVVIFKNMNLFLNLLSSAKRDFYNGPLGDNQIFDIFLLANVYSSSGTELDGPIFRNIIAQTPVVAANHPDFTKSEIVEEGLIAADSLYKYIDWSIKNYSYFTWQYR
jgi:hypothetical protein